MLRSFRTVMLAVAVTAMGIGNGAYGMTTTVSAASIAQATAKIALQGKSYLEIKEAVLLPDGKNKRAVFTVTWHNKDAKDLDIRDYILIFYDSSNVSYSLKTLTPVTNILPANAIKSYDYYAEVPATATLANLNLKIQKWDFNVAGYKRYIGQSVMNKAAFPIAASGTQGLANLDQTSFGFSVKSLFLSKKEDKQDVDLELVLVNKGKRTEDLPDYKYELRTPKGYHYPLTLTFDDPGQKLTPNQNIGAKLEGDVPVDETLSGAELWITRDLYDQDQEKFAMPLTILKVPAATVPTVSAGNATFTNEEGRFQVTMNSIARHPWEDEDLLISEMIIKNISSDAVVLPTLSGHYLLDETVEVETSFVKLDQLISLQAGQEIRYHVIGKVPYTNAFKQAKFYLKEAVKTGAQTNLRERARITLQQADADKQRIALNDSYTYQDLGRSFSYKVVSANEYIGNSDKLFVTEVLVENKDKRFTTLDQLFAHFESEDGTIYPATVESPNASLSPGNKAIATVWAALPMDVDTGDLSLMTGQAVTGNSLSKPGQQAEAYIRAVTFALPTKLAEVGNLDDAVQFGPYAMQFTKLERPAFYYSQVNFKFSYDLSKNVAEKRIPGAHRLYIVLEDESGREFFTREFPMEVAGDPNSLKLGEHTMEIQYNSPGGLSLYGSGYVLKVYDMYQDGYKKLLASKSLM